jgi:hypothetical protein
MFSGYSYSSSNCTLSCYIDFPFFFFSQFWGLNTRLYTLGKWSTTWAIPLCFVFEVRGLPNFVSNLPSIWDYRHSPSCPDVSVFHINFISFSLNFSFWHDLHREWTRFLFCLKISNSVTSKITGIYSRASRSVSPCLSRHPCSFTST